MFVPRGENIVEKKICPLSGEEFFVTDRDLEFYDKVSPIFNGEKYSIPSPTLSPDERKRRRMSMRNDRHVYFSSIEGKLSVFSKERGYISFQPQKYWGDDWSPHDYASDFDFNQDTFSQFHELSKKVPKLARSITTEENCDYVNQAGMIKDCYLVFGGNDGEKLYYGNRFFFAKNCIDFLGAMHCEHCYQIVDCLESYGLRYCQECTNCRDSWFLYSCFNCEQCFGCINLVAKRFCFFNTQLTEEEYNKRLKEFSPQKHLETMQVKIKNFFLTQVYRENTNQKSENVIGNKIISSENVFNSFLIFGCKDMKYCDEMAGKGDNNNYDINAFGYGTTFSYEGITLGHGTNHALFCHDCWENVHDLLYCMYCNKGVNNCFLSDGLKKAHHCIMNKSYSVQEYETLCGKIIDHMRSAGEWGEFFSHILSPFGYNETIAQEYFPISPGQEGWYEVPEGLMKGTMKINWSNEEIKPTKETSFQTLSIDQYDERLVGFEKAQKNIDELLHGIIICEVTKKPFKIIKQELAFYIENGIPIPTKHPDQRHRERMALRNPRKLFERKCAECRKEIVTTYAPERTEKVLCEECYRKLVY